MFHRLVTVLAFIMPLIWNPVGVSATEPSESTPSTKAEELWNKGYLLHVVGEYKAAIKFFRKSIKIHPTAEAHTFLGWTLSFLGQIDEAITECKKAIHLDPDFGNPYNDIGVYLTQLNQLRRAIPWLKKAIKAKRYCCRQFPHFNLGRIYLMQGRLVEAKEQFEKSLSFEPKYLPALEGLKAIRKKGLRSL